MKKTFLFSMLAVLLAGFGFGGISLADDVAQIVGGDGYGTLQAAITEAGDGAEVKVLNDIDEHITISSKNITLDLNGKTIDPTTPGTVIDISNSTVSIKGNGTVRNSQNGAYLTVAAHGTSNVTIENGTYESVSTGNTALIYAYEGGTITIKGGSYKGAPDPVKEGKVIYAGAPNNVDGYQDKYGTIVIEGGVFTGRISDSNWGRYVVKGGTFDRNEVVHYNNPAVGDSTNTNTTITFAEAGFLPGCYIMTEDNGLRSVSYDPVATMGGTGYCTVTGAIAAATEGQTVEIIKAGSYTLPDEISYNITIKGAVDGVKITKKAADNPNLANVPNGATFENITLDLDTELHNGFGASDERVKLHNTTPIIMKNCVINGSLYTRGNMEFDGCTFNVSGTKVWNVWMWQGNLTFKNCIFNGEDRNIHAVANGPENPVKETQWNIKIENCIFSKTKSKDKAAVIVKETNGADNTGLHGYVLNYKVEITNPSISGNKDYYAHDHLGNEYYMMDELIAGGDTDGSYVQQPDPAPDFVGSGTTAGGNVIVILDGTTVYSTPKRGQTWTVTFDGTGDVVVADGAKVAKPADPSKSCYSFNGWYSGSTAYDFNTVVTSDLALTSSWTYTCGGGGGSGKTSGTTKVTEDKTTTDADKTDEDKTEETNDETPNQEEDLPPLASQEELQNPEDQDWYDKSGDQQEVLEDGLTREMHNAYEFAVRAGITTMKSAEEANMYGPLNRIAMAKMLVNYAINVLGMKPDTTKQVPNFGDVSEQLNKDYGDAVTLAYQLGIMGIGITDFRPFDEVPRGEFGTALSRMLFGLADGQGDEAFYEPHLQKLKETGIITNDNPDLEEVRGYVMIMLMRSANKKA